MHLFAALLLIRYIYIVCQIDVTPTLHLVCAPGNQLQELGARSKVRNGNV